MKEIFISKSYNLINSYYPNNEIKIKFGLESLYVILSKTIIIFLISYLLGILNKTLICLLLFNIIRPFSFGRHFNSKTCLISSIIVFVIIPKFLVFITISNFYKILISILCILLIGIYSPKESRKRRYFKNKFKLKLLSLIAALMLFYLSFYMIEALYILCIQTILVIS